jgi:hypothetical protein
MVELAPVSVPAAIKAPATKDPTKAKEATPPKTTALLRFVIPNERAFDFLGKKPLGL